MAAGGGQSASGPGWGDLIKALLAAYQGSQQPGANAPGQGYAQQYGMHPRDLPEAPAALSRTRQVGRKIGTEAAGFIPVAGPFLKAGLGIVGDEAQHQAASKYMKQLQEADPRIAEFGLKTPYVEESKTDRNRRIGRKVGRAVAGYFTGGISDLALGKVDERATEKAAQKRQREAAKIQARNQSTMAEYGLGRQYQQQARQFAMQPRQYELGRATQPQGMQPQSQFANPAANFGGGGFNDMHPDDQQALMQLAQQHLGGAGY